MIGIERRDFVESESCWNEVEDSTANQTAYSKSDEAGEEAGVEAAGHKGEDAHSNNTGQADQSDHEQAITPDLRTAWLHFALGRQGGIEGGDGLKGRG